MCVPERGGATRWRRFVDPVSPHMQSPVPITRPPPNAFQRARCVLPPGRSPSSTEPSAPSGPWSLLSCASDGSVAHGSQSSQPAHSFLCMSAVAGLRGQRGRGFTGANPEHACSEFGDQVTYMSTSSPNPGWRTGRRSAIRAARAPAPGPGRHTRAPAGDLLAIPPGHDAGVVESCLPGHDGGRGRAAGGPRRAGGAGRPPARGPRDGARRAAGSRTSGAP